jgi:hypothetical protein
MHNLVLNVRVLDRISDRPGKDHDVKDRSKPAGLDVRGVVPVECAHKACPVQWNLLPQPRRHVGNFRVGAHCTQYGVRLAGDTSSLPNVNVTRTKRQTSLAGLISFAAKSCENAPFSDMLNFNS